MSVSDKDATALFLAYEKAKTDIAALKEKLKATPFRKVILAEKTSVKSGSGVQKKPKKKKVAPKSRDEPAVIKKKKAAPKAKTPDSVVSASALRLLCE
jgi:hypothetical protein